MKRVPVWLLSLLSLIAPVLALDYDVFILAGQSQGVNYDNNAANLPVELQSPQTNVKFWYNFGWWPDNSSNGVLSSNGTWGNLAPQAKGSTSVFSSRVPSGGSGFGPEITLGHDLAAALPTRNIAIVKYTFNSTSLAQRTDREGWNVNDRNQIYDGMLAEVNAALAALTDAGHTASVKGFLWIQGEGDQGDRTYANAYQQNLTDLFTGVRNQWNSEMVAVTVRLSTAQVTDWWRANGYNEEGFNIVRAAQVAVGEAGPRNGWINTDDLNIVPNTVHFNEASTQTIGSRMAAKYVELVPEPSSLALLIGGAGAYSLLRRRRG